MTSRRATIDQPQAVIDDAITLFLSGSLGGTGTADRLRRHRGMIGTEEVLLSRKMGCCFGTKDWLS